MTDPVQEQLSACLDSELPEAELDLLLKRLERDSRLGESIGRYALIREALRDERPVRASADFAARVSAAVAVQGQVSRPLIRVPRNAAKWLRPAAGMAVAAGVAAVAVMSIQPRIEPAGQMAETLPSVQPTAPVSLSSERPSYIVPTTSTTAFIPATRLTNYVVAHSEYATPLGRRTVLNGVLAEDDTLIEETADAPPESEVSVPHP